MTYSFDKLCIVAEPDAYLYDGTTLTQITDPDPGKRQRRHLDRRVFHVHRR
jgi:hypothetical protein